MFAFRFIAFPEIPETQAHEFKFQHNSKIKMSRIMVVWSGHEMQYLGYFAKLKCDEIQNLFKKPRKVKMLRKFLALK